jgi:RNA recognition motif-containing protein
MGDRRDYRERDRSRSRDSRAEGATTSLLIRNLSYRVRADEIRRLMIRYGEVRDVYLPQVNRKKNSIKINQ